MLNRIMAEAYAMATEYGPLGEDYDDELYKSYLKLTVYTAGKLAPYQDPQLATVKVGGDRDNRLMVREGVTSKQIMEELRGNMLRPACCRPGWSMSRRSRQRASMRSPNHEQMGRRGGYGARTVEQTHSIVIDELRRAGYVGAHRRQTASERVAGGVRAESAPQPASCLSGES